MPPLAAIERFFERLFERPSARLFRTRVQPVQIQRSVERAMEAGRRSTGERTIVPNWFIVHLSPGDVAELADTAQELALELADQALDFARAHQYVLHDRPRVDLLGDPTVQRADIRVEGRLAPPRAAGQGDRSPGTSEAVSAGGSSPMHPTAVFAVPFSRAPRAVLKVTDPDGRKREIAIESSELTIGRASDNDLVARDVRVSRHHGRIVGRHGTLVYLDLGSTNGSRVNGEPVVEVVLGLGDRLEVGETALVLEEGGTPA
jgi:hypothetical protein